MRAVASLGIHVQHGAARAHARAERQKRESRAALHWPRVRTRLRAPAFLPFERFRAAADAILQRVVGVGRFVVGLARHVLQHEVDRVHAQLAGHVVHHRLDAEEALRELRAAEISRRRLVGVDRVHQRFHVRNLIQVDAADGPGIFPVRAHAAVAAQLQRLQCAVAADAHLVVLHRGPAAVHADVIFLARELQLDRRAGLPGQHGRDQVGILILVLVAEVAAHVLAHHADFILRNPQVARHIGPAIGDAPGGRVDGQPVALPRGQADARLHLRVVHEGG